MEHALSEILWAFWLPLLAAAVGAGLGYMLVSDWREIRAEMRRIHGETGEETLDRFRMQVRLMRRDYMLRPGERFTHDMLSACDRLEETLERMQREAAVQ